MFLKWPVSLLQAIYTHTLLSDTTWGASASSKVLTPLAFLHYYFHHLFVLLFIQTKLTKISGKETNTNANLSRYEEFALRAFLPTHLVEGGRQSVHFYLTCGKRENLL